jgi:hypothetical protein
MRPPARLDPRFGTPRYLSVRQPYAQAIRERDDRLPGRYYREPSSLEFGVFWRRHS